MGRDEIRQLKKLWRRLWQWNQSTSNDESKREARQKEIIEAPQTYLDLARELWGRAEKRRREIQKKGGGTNKYKILKIEEFINHARRQIEPTDRRVIHGQTIPHEEKVFSIFEPHTEWLSKGKAGVPVERGLTVCLLEDPYRFILHHRVMPKAVDVEVAVGMVQETQQRFPQLSSCSFDRGFHSPDNQRP